jgi:hypothetical protein
MIVYLQAEFHTQSFEWERLLVDLRCGSLRVIRSVHDVQAGHRRSWVVSRCGGKVMGEKQVVFSRLLQLR